MPSRSRPARTPPVVFDDAAWAEDMLRASAGARAVAEDARGAFKENGVPIDQLRACAAEGTDGTALPHCVKVYLPASAGPHGMVFEIDRVAGRLCLLYVGLGLRHPSRDMRQPSVYQVAHRRLHSGSEN
jgi:hypothetical protein